MAREKKRNNKTKMTQIDAKKSCLRGIERWN